MKKLIFLILAAILCVSFASAQIAVPKLQLNKGTTQTIRVLKPFALFGCGLLSGSSHGVGEIIRLDYPTFQKEHPKADPYFWNPQLSYLNKWKNNDPTQGPAFPLSTTSLVAVTDAYHLLPAVERWSLMAGCITITLGEKRPWWEYALNFVALNAGYYVGFNALYHLKYGKPY